MIGIIAAMDLEVEAIIQQAEVIKKEIHGITFYEGTLAKQNVIIMKSGVGKGNAAMSTTILNEHYALEAIINIGTAGGLKPEEQILDAVLSERVVQHDFDTSAVDGDEGIGMYFDADVALLQVCKEVLEGLKVKVHQGLVASGDQFIAGEEKLKQLMQKFPEAMCAEMEAGAIAQVCTHYHIPFVILRSLSDVACHKDSHMDFIEYAKHASERSAQFCFEFMRKW
ncbi:5'-methylthioadenosine/adenosylhomocysteine nucleosidase [[Eubacterium] hominis]|uniref:5'-methylthioadenosine/adenosylhomocysteine nucleosidase n=1 Tax=[Eubacterium] hominis TaxID=2764325 RepID=UPI003A4DA089